jgi:hypothetical protein
VLFVDSIIRQILQLLDNDGEAKIDFKGSIDIGTHLDRVGSWELGVAHPQLLTHNRESSDPYVDLLRVFTTKAYDF